MNRYSEDDNYRAATKASQKRRSKNREQSADYLKSREIPYTEHNAGAHLIVEGALGYIDFWPGTGKWKSREGKEGFGVRNLVKSIQQERV